MSYWVLSSLHGGRFAHVIPGYVWEARAAEVRAAFQHAYHSYELLGFPHDEIKPISNDTSDQFNGWGVTALDSLDTMIIMGLDEELQRALKHLEKLDFFSHDKSVPFFETVIRYLGGLLSTWHLTKLPLTLKQADNLGLALLPAFNTSIQFPSYSVNPVTKEVDGAWSGHANFGLAESASCQMEYKYLAKLTGRTEFFDAAQNVMDGLLEMQDPDTQMWSQWISDEGSKPVAKARPQFSVGAGGDSAYEYLLKQYLLSGKSEPQMLEMYLSSIRGVITNLLYVSKQRNLLYVTDIAYSKPDRASKILVPVPSGDLEHLSCFLPGLLALGAHTLRDIPENVFPAEERKLHLDIAKGLATTCYLVYADSFTGLAPDVINFGARGGRSWSELYRQWENHGRHGTPPGLKVDVPVQKDPSKRGYDVRLGRWLSRPETIESLFILYRVTGEQIWRNRGYEIFEAIQMWSKGPVGYASVWEPDSPTPERMDEMPRSVPCHSMPQSNSRDALKLSYFLAETLKYLYLLFKEDDCGLSLDEIVFNTEAHPLPVFQWTPQEMEHYRLQKRPSKGSGPTLKELLRAERKPKPASKSDRRA
ncbi:hypothetical protein M407DRAFT_29999 [Tulasnella calospora MUT 4182]|uniref:alpha-1,2-Mannosidase n=1 Tax=Tulasnella calospora MUT 4182 TaxID=1051891 RepID=A0A0C3LG04_9AGAM|nr:hypothetical protein M407DRAFT_29999 [Tulasnella calospora MUT 4182]